LAQNSTLIIGHSSLEIVLVQIQSYEHAMRIV